MNSEYISGQMWVFLISGSPQTIIEFPYSVSIVEWVFSKTILPSTKEILIWMLALQVQQIIAKSLSI